MNEARTILVIDDNKDDQELYRRALNKSAVQYAIHEAQDGDQGLARMDTPSPDCVLLDYSLPGHDGIEVLKRIRSRYPFVPVVMLTGQGNEKVAVAAMQHGAQNYIAKSAITPETLEHVIQMAIEHCRLQKRIYEQRTSLEVFTRALAHDLNEPVRTIRSFIDLLSQTENFSDKGQGYFHHIQHAADRMRMLIDTVFLYTRLDDPGQMPREVCAMDTLLKEAEANLNQMTQEQHATISADHLPQVYASRPQLIQLLQNLLSNAVRHSERPVTVHISAVPQGGEWLFRIEDNGPGIDAAHLCKIFEPFKRLGHCEEPGAGLGLAICKKIVESHGGRIWCESSPGRGAAFLFTLPKALPISLNAPSKNAASAVTGPAAMNGNDAACLLADTHALANILLVDDSKAFIEMAKFELIERSGLQCHLFTARDGEEAMTQLCDKAKGVQPIDLVLLDINMPEMDGFEVLERMRADDTLKGISVVMCTGSDYDKDVARAKTLGATGYITKPIEFSRLKAIIDIIPGIRLCPGSAGYSLVRAA